MNKKYIPLMIGSLLLSGCVKGPTVTEENALEVAVDDSNTDMTEVTSSDMKKEDGVFKVEFTTESGKYSYTVGSDGLVVDRKYEPGAAEEERIEQAKEEPKEESPKQEENKDDEKTRAENSALSNVGLSREDVTSITSELNAEQTQYTVVIVSAGNTTTCIVNAETGEVVSTVFE